MMKCNEIGFGTSDCAYNIMLPWLCKFEWEDESERKPKYVCIDKCLLPEILKLWEMGIKTTGCCCGHGNQPAFIGVDEQFIGKMKSMGYEVQFNEYRPGDEDTFKPKTKLCYGVADKGFNWWDENK